MSCSRLPSKYWSEKETSMLHFAFLCFGPNWKKIAQILPGRTIIQIKQKYNYINSKLAIPDTTNIPLDDINFENIYNELKRS